MSFVSIARMHHIRSLKKFRRLKQSAEHARVSGLAKKGRPGVLVFQGEKDEISAFLEAARALRYLDFHHVDTVPFRGRFGDSPGQQLVDRGKLGLEEMKDMGELLNRLERVGGLPMREWCCKQLFG